MKHNLPYFSHDNNARNHPKMKALIAEYGYEGYGRFWALNERIAETEGAYIDISKKVNKLDLAKELGLDGNGLDRFLAFLSDPEIDLINIIGGKITTDRISELHSKVNKKRGNQRKNDNEEIGDENTEIDSDNEEIGGDFDTDKIRSNKIRSDKNIQDKIKQDSSGSAEKGINKTPSQKLKKLPLREREPVNDMERVERAYLQNWDMLYSQKRVKTTNPIVNWNKTRKLIKTHFEKLKSEQIIQALNNGLRDNWIMNGGYSLAVMLSASVLNKLINARQEAPPRLADKKPISRLKSIF